MKKVSDEELLAAAKEAQYEVIKRWMLEQYFGGRARIGKWGDHKFHLSSFSAAQVKSPLSTDQIRSRLRKLPGVQSLPHNRWAGFKFSREVCDELAAQAKAYWESQGLSDEEIRSYFK